MAISDVAKSVGTAIKAAFGRDAAHDAACAALAQLKRRHEEQAGPVQARLEAARRAYDEWKKPERELAEAEAAVRSFSWAHHGERCEAERAVRSSETSTLAEFRDEVENWFARALAIRPPFPEREDDPVTLRARVLNADEIDKVVEAKHGRLVNGRREPSALAVAQQALVQELPLLDATQQRERIRQLREAIEQSFVGIDLPSLKDAREGERRV